ncbi:MAG: ABC transporter substrate-binding protein [Oscillospiraceae bacterium]|nr:ABC transporter substrate-binding protein [Oscillospiraceae bacterium]MBR5980191.1 ABC transporter substrate-binding protein [Oscillospiraceae bacterium]
MKKNRTIAALILLMVMVMSILSGCGKKEPEPEPTPEPEPVDTSIVFTDMAGREVKLEKAAEKIVALEPSDCEILFAIGAGNTLVGRGEYCDYPAQVMDIPSVQSGYETNIEAVIELGPEVVIMTKMAQTEDQINAFENAGIKVVMTDAQDINGIYECVNMIGKVTGKEDSAANVVSQMKSAFDSIKKEGAGQGKTVYFEVSPLQWGLWAAGSGTFMDEAAQMLGLTNIFGDQAGWLEVSEEQVISADPDYIVTITMYYGEGPTPVEEICSRPGWEKLKAVVNEDIINIQDNSLSRPSPRLVDGITAMNVFIEESLAQDAAA